jgi:serine/threonine protein kinase
MLYGKYPFRGMTDAAIFKEIKKGPPNFSLINISAKAKEFINRCLTIDPEERISWV